MRKIFLESENINRTIRKLMIAALVCVSTLCCCSFVSNATLPDVDVTKSGKMKDTHENSTRHAGKQKEAHDVSEDKSRRSMLEDMLEGPLKEKLTEVKDNSTCLDLSYIKLSNEDIRSLFEYLSFNVSVKELHVDYAKMGDEGAKALAEGLMSNSTVQSVSLMFNDIGNEGVRALADVFARSSILETINLRSNCIHSEGAKAIATAIKDSSKPIVINVTDNPIGYDGAAAILAAIKVNPQYKKLDLRESLNTERVSAQLQRRLTMTFNPSMPFYLNLKSCPIEDLLLDCNILSDDEVVLLAGALESGAVSLKRLSLSKTGLKLSAAKEAESEKPFTALMNALKKNTSLESVNLADNSVGDAGAKLIADVLRVNKSLTSINLGRTQIGDSGAMELIDAIYDNVNLQECILVSNRITSGIGVHMFKLLSHTSLVTLDLSGNPLGKKFSTEKVFCDLQGSQGNLNVVVNFVCDEVVPQLTRKTSRMGFFRK